MSEGMELDGVYFRFGDVEPLADMRAVMVYRTPGGTLVCRACDDPDGRLAVILSHITAGELAMLMQCTGTPVVERRSA